MKAILLAAGKGKRLGELTKSVPKPMLRIGRKPILEYNIEWLRDYGIREIFINLHYLPDLIRNYFKKGKKWGVKIEYSYEPNLLGTAGAVRKIFEDYQIKNSCNENKDNPFLVVYGDNLYEFNLSELKNFHEKNKGIATIGLHEKEKVDQSGIVLLNDKNRITKFIEKPNAHEMISHLVNTGLYILEPQVLEYIPSNKSLDFGKDIFPKMIQKNEKITGVILKGKLTAVDTPALYKEIRNNH